MNGKYFDSNRDFMEMIQSLDEVVRKTLIPLLFLLAVAAFLYGLPFKLVPLGALLAVFFIVSEIMLRTIKNGFVQGEIGYTALLSFDCILLAFTMHVSGGFESFAPLLYAIIVMLAGLTLPFWNMAIVLLFSVLSYFIELQLEISGAIPHMRIYQEFTPPTIFADSAYLRVTPAANLAVGISLALLAFTVAEMLRRRKERLVKLNKELDQSVKLLARRDLEHVTINQQLDEKVRELNSLKEELETKVNERTNELNNKVIEQESTSKKLKDNLAELEAFHDATVGRELRMIELEKELETLRQERRSEQINK
jgi:hypothetical protein